MSNTYLVQIADMIVREDIVQTIRAQHPGARVLATGTQAGSLAVLDAAPAVTLAFLEAGPTDLADSVLVARITALGGSFVIVGEWPVPQVFAGLRGFLERPFTSAQVAGFLTTPGP